MLVFFFILFANLNSLEFYEKIPKESYDNWNLLIEDTISVYYTNYHDINWGYTTNNFEYNIDVIYDTLKKLNDYDEIFGRVVESKLLDSNQGIVYIRLDMPLFLSDRDYTVKFLEKISPNKSQITFQFQSVTHPDAPYYESSVTLPNAGGEWRLTKVDNNTTKVEYIWNGELLGMFPSYQLTTAWKTQGIEVLSWLKKYISKKNRKNEL